MGVDHVHALLSQQPGKADWTAPVQAWLSPEEDDRESLILKLPAEWADLV
jgi:hypothetical protein